MDRGRYYEPLGVLAALFIGLLFRLLPAKNAIVDGTVIFYGYDPFYHIRRIHFTFENFPSTLWFDGYLHHPQGLDLLWPPLFDQAVAGAALLFAGGAPAVEMTAALAPPILGALAILILYLLARKLFGVRVAILSAFLLAVDPWHIGRTHFGFPDHDGLESLLILTALLLLAYALSDRDRGLVLGAAAGVLMAAASYTWLGAPIYMGAILIYATVQVASDLGNKASPSETVVPLASAFGAALLLMIPFRGEAWLHPSFLAALGGVGALAFIYLLSRLFAAAKVSWALFIPAVAVCVYLAVILSSSSAFTQEASSLFLEGMGYFFFGGLAAGSILEATAIYKTVDIFSLPSLGLAFSVLGLFIMIRHGWPGTIPRDRLLFLVWAAFTLSLSVSQVRFLYLFSLSGSVLVALLFFSAHERIEGSRRWRPSVKPLLSFALLAVLLLPSLAGVVTTAGYRPEISGDWLETLEWLSSNTPETSGFNRPDRPGEYGVLSWWDYGNWILLQSRRPVVANNFQAGARESARFFLSGTEDEAVAVAEARDVRYVITDGKMVYSKLPAIPPWIGEDPADYIVASTDPESSYPDLVAFKHTEKFLSTTLARLHLFDASGLGSFRLVYESKTTEGSGYPTKEVKVFERVAGARISGATPSDRPMGAILEMTSNQGRRFHYYNSAMPVDGRYEITVPYSTDGRLETHSIGPYIVGPVEDFAGGDYRIVNVTEEDVLSGRVVDVNF
ncbi:MAG: Oligosaccharyl transferase [Methanothrix sp.]|nr:MAG: Oligosaccharyl transferase [Methanothrix sp.]